MNEPKPEDLAIIRQVTASPRYFIEEILGETLDAQQIPLVEEFPYHRKIAVKSGHSGGKDFLAARLALWYKIVHQPSIVVTTGPTDRQVQHIVWGEIRAAYRKSRYPLGGYLMPIESLLRDPENEKNYMIGFTARDDSSFQGLHSENVLVVVTEAQGIDPRIWPGIESLLSAPNAKLLLIGNAIFVPESPFYAAFTSQRGQYANFTLDSRKSSYCSKEYIEDIRQTYSEGSPMWQARVEGIFPTDIADTLIPLGWIERAQEAFKADETPIEVSSSLGCDIARQGSDHTVFYEGKGEVFRCVHDVQGQDLMQTVGEIAKRINGGILARRVRIDDTGVGGGVSDRLRELGHQIVAINFGKNSTDETIYRGSRSEMFWGLRERFREGRIKISPQDSRLARDLSVLKSRMTSKGQILLEEKSRARERLGYSPDRADALALAAMEDGMAFGLESSGEPGMGMFEYIGQLARKNREETSVAGRSPGKLSEAVVKTPLIEVTHDSDGIHR